LVQINNLNKNFAQELLNNPVPNDILDLFNADYRIDKKIIQSYRKNGFVKLENILEGNALEFSNKIVSAAVFLRKEQDKRTLQEKSEYEKSFLQCGYLCWDYQPVKSFVFMA
jgi:hypothetical protein